MDNYPRCTVANPRGALRQNGLLGTGEPLWPANIANRMFANAPNMSELYATSDYNAAVFIIHQLKSEEPMSAREVEESVSLLQRLLRQMSAAADISLEELQRVQQMAESIKGIGPLLFSPANIAGTVVNLSNMSLALAQNKTVSDLLDLPPDQKARLKNWVDMRGKAGARSAKKISKGKIKLVWLRGALHFQIPATAQSVYYTHRHRVPGVVNVPVYGAKRGLSRRAWVAADGARGLLKYTTSGTAGVVLAVGPQAYLDYKSSATLDEFYRKSAYSQPANIAAVAAGIAAGGAIAVGAAAAGFGLALILVIAGTALVSGGTLYAIGELGLDKKFGDLLMD
ncbi:hypothetical protein [Pseudomonas sp. Marseille-Q5115]|uniref:hypothetical protein n=1 Tax=Pseudomonas sp. Marseille-Q5115 TaxID=2866593 RepID=UPI001CE3C958|nr:hypothetical protein [Pseudomonas sp. Marseille-Q5115]